MGALNHTKTVAFEDEIKFEKIEINLEFEGPEISLWADLSVLVLLRRDSWPRKV